MVEPIRALAIALAGAVLVAGCSLSLPAPVPLEEGVLGLDGIPVTLTDAGVGGSDLWGSTSTRFSGVVAASFEVDDAGIPAPLRRLFRVASIEEEIGLDVTLVASSEADLPESFTVASASLTGVVVKRGVQTLYGPGDFGPVAGAAMTFTRGDCDDDGSCSYGAGATTGLAEIGLAGGEADRLAKGIVAGGTGYTVTATFSVTVDPALPADTVIEAELVSLGAVLE